MQFLFFGVTVTTIIFLYIQRLALVSLVFRLAEVVEIPNKLGSY